MSTLILVEHNNENLSEINYPVLTAALKLDSDVTLLVIGYKCSQVAEEASALSGVKEVLYLDDSSCEYALAEDLSQIIVDIASRFYLYTSSCKYFW